MVVTARRIAAALALAGLCFIVGLRAGYAARRPKYESYGSAELSWVSEGIMERISELEDELAYVRRLQGLGPAER